MHFVSLVASARKWGNSEALAQIALTQARESGADSGELIHLSQFRLEQCNGCMRCVFRDEPCSLDDDIYRLLDLIYGADALFLAVPTYVLSIPGSLKLVMDRLLLTWGYLDRVEYGHPAASVGVAGLPDWNQFQLPLMNLFLLSLGFRVVDSFMAYAPGPGEVLLDEGVLSRVRGMVYRLCALAQGEEVEKPGDMVTSHCPVCFSQVFERLGGGRFRCPVCLVEAEEREGALHFPAESLSQHRWTRERVRRHFQHWILKTREPFLARRSEIKNRRRELELD